MREKRGKLMKVIVVSHGSYARGLVDTAQMIAGEQEDLEAFGLEPEESVDTLREKIRESIEQTSEGEEVLILTDLFYGSPFNTVISLMSEYDQSSVDDGSSYGTLRGKERTRGVQRSS